MVHQVHMVEEDLPLHHRKDRLQVQTLSAHSNQIEVSYFSLRRLHARVRVYRLWQWFGSVDTDRSGHITAEELQRALINGDWSRTCYRDTA